MILPAINEPTPELAKYHPAWSRIRAFEEGEEAVKARGEALLPRINSYDSYAQYARHLDNTNLYPATTKIAQGIHGLVFRKPPQLASGSARVQLLSRSATPRNQSLTWLAGEVVRETLITNWTGLLVDHPPREAFQGLNAANADRLGYRPRLTMYAAESILEVTHGPMGLNHQLVRVRLLEDQGRRVRELLINAEGHYEVRVHVQDDQGRWATAPRVTIPTMAGEPLAEIPFTIVSTSDGETPRPSVLKPMVDLNLQHYRLSGLLANTTWMTSGPIITAIGFERETDGDGVEVDPQWDFAPNAVIEIKSKDVSLDYHIFDPKGAELMLGQLDGLKQDLHTLGHSMLAPEKAAPESPETSLIRRSAENAMLAAITRAISSKLEWAMGLFARWVDGSEVAYSLNLDFMPAGLTPQEHRELREDWLAGAITHEAYLYTLRDGEVLSAALDPVAEVERARAEAADRPPLGL